MFEPAFDKVLSSAKTDEEWLLRRKDGSVFAADVTAAKISDDSLLGIVRDITDRKRAADDLQQSQKQLAGIIGSAMDAIITIDVSGKVLLFNSSAETMFGCSAEVAIGGDLDRFIPQKFRNIHRHHIEEFSRTNVTRRSLESLGTLLAVRENGDEFPIEASISQFETGGKKFYTVIIRDITSREMANEALLASEERYRDLIENAQDVIYTQDLEGRFTSVNKIAELFSGYTHDEMLGLKMADIVAPEHLAEASKMLEAKLSGESTTSYETELIVKDGRRVAADVNSWLVYRNGVPVGIQGIARDVTDRKRTLAELRASEERFGSLVQNAQDVIYSHDFEGNYTSMNEIGCRLSGYSLEEVLSMNIADSLTPESLETARKMIEIHLSGQEAPYHRAEIVRKDGSHFPAEIKSWLTYRDGVPYGVEGIARDITERIELEDKLRQSQKLEAVGLLAGGIAHDFNNLLTVITGYSDLSLKRMPTEDPSRKNIEQIKEAGVRAAELTGQLLAFSRKQVLKPTVHNLNSVITNIERMLKRIIRESIELETDLAPDLSNIKADPGQIEQVIMNLVVNARDAMPNGGVLTISTCNVHLEPDELYIQDTCKPGKYVKMTVADTGEGMNEETKRRMFEPFFTTKKLGKGTGLGLATVHGIVKQSGGEIRVSSVVGEGTTFDIFFPCVDDEQEKQKWTDSDVVDHSGTETVLIVEDDANLRELVKTILVPHGYNVLSAADGSEALEICKTFPGQVHLLLTDVVMPQMSGITVRDRVVELLPDIKVLFMSGYIEESSSDKDLLETDDALIKKPFDPDSLSTRVREILDA